MKETGGGEKKKVREKEKPWQGGLFVPCSLYKRRLGFLCPGQGRTYLGAEDAVGGGGQQGLCLGWVVSSSSCCYFGINNKGFILSDLFSLSRRLLVYSFLSALPSPAQE